MKVLRVTTLALCAGVWSVAGAAAALYLREEMPGLAAALWCRPFLFGGGFLCGLILCGKT